MAKPTKTRNKAGRPPKWETAEQIQEALDWYFEDCEERKVLPSKAGMCYTLDMTRESLSRYIDNPKFSDTVRKAFARIEMFWVERLPTPGSTGVAFYLKNAYGADYREKSETDVTTKGEAIGGADIVALAAKAAALLKEEKI